MEVESKNAEEKVSEEKPKEVERNEDEVQPTVKEENKEKGKEQENPNLTVCLFNVPRKLDQKRMKKEIDQLNLQGVLKVKKRPNWEFAHVTFADAQAKEDGVHALRRHQIKGQKINVSDSQRQKGKNRDDKRKKFEKYETDKAEGEEGEGEEGEEGENKRTKKEDKDDVSKGRGRGGLSLTVDDVVTPLHKHTYEQQLEQKKSYIVDKLRGIVRRLLKDSAYDIPQWVKGSKDNKLCCPLVRLYSSPVTKGYRNKCSLTIGLDKDNKPLIGFAMGQTKDGNTTVGDPSNTINMSERTQEVRRAMQQCVVESGRTTWEKVSHQGFWRELTIRVCRTNQVMAIMQANPTGLSEDELKIEEERLIKHFSTISDIVGSSLQVQYWSGWANVASYETPIKSLMGPTHIQEILMGLKFRISANSFFQPNTAAAEVLYKVVGDWATVNPETTVLDIYCGTGTIGLSLAKKAKLVVGVEEVEDAIKDAYQNATNNGIENVKYVVGKAEHQLAAILKQYGENCVAIVDPPRAGLHPLAVRAIRECSSLKKLIYVSCNQDSLVADASHLCRSSSRNLPGDPFVPVRCAAVDLFPHTAHVEAILLFERVVPSENKLSPSAYAVQFNPSEPVMVRMDLNNMGMLNVDSVLPDPVASSSTASSTATTEEKTKTDASE